MKSVLLSIKPKYCELIASGQKTVEIRKNRPKIDVPFKVYIYCTKKFDAFASGRFQWDNCGVIGEFVCDDITSYRMCMGVPENLVREGTISFDEIWKYCNKGENDLYAWHISDLGRIGEQCSDSGTTSLVIYDKPKELSEFSLTRPPQSWCYVEELEARNEN